jgi:hypothetical protein
MDGGRAMKVAVIGPADLTAEVAAVADIAGAGRRFDGLEVWALPYHRVDQAAELYARAAARADAVLFTGPLGYHRGTRGQPVPAVPTAYVPYSPLWLYAPLFAVDDRASLRRVSLDSLDPGVLEATYRELGLPLENVEVYDPRADAPAPPAGNVLPDDPPADEVAAFHRRARAEGRATHALSGVLAVYRLLRAAGVPCAWLVPSRVALQEALEKLLYEAEGVRARGARIVVGLVRPRDNGLPFKAARLRLKAHELLLSQVEEFDGHLVDLGSGDFQFFTTRAHFEKTTSLYSHWPLLERLVQAGLEMSAGVGLGATAGEAGGNARAALDEALRGVGSACFVMLEDRRLVGPLGATARELGAGGPAFGPGASLPRGLAALDGMAGDFTARDLALRLGLGRRTAHRVLSRLREAGDVVEVGQESNGARGRPRRVYRRHRDALDGEGGGRA